MRRLLAALLCTACIVLAGCSVIWPEPDASGADTESFQVSAAQLREYQNKWCYSRLDDRLKKAYSAVYAAVKQGFSDDETVTISDTSKGEKREYPGVQVKLPEPLQGETEAKKLYAAFTRDNPQFFYIGNVYGFDGHQAGGTSRFTVFKLVYTMNASERKEARSQLQDVCRDLLATLSDTATAFEKELALHDALLDRCTYDNAAAEAPSPVEAYPQAFSAYGALVQGKAVCEGYARAMQLLLEEADIPATVVTGFDENKRSHMWNIVTVEGRNYHLDPTWNDSGDLIRHTYFNMTSADMLLTHSLDDENFGIDTCTATAANYFTRTGAYFNTYSLEDIARVVAREVEAGAETIELRFSPDKLQNGSLFIRQESWFTSTVTANLKDKTMWPYDYEVNQTYSIITITKKPE